MESVSNMTPRQQYWANLARIHSVTGVWARRTTFAAAAEIAVSLTYYVEQGYPVDVATQRAYDHAFYITKRVTV